MATFSKDLTKRLDDKLNKTQVKPTQKSTPKTTQKQETKKTTPKQEKIFTPTPAKQAFEAQFQSPKITKTFVPTPVKKVTPTNVTPKITPSVPTFDADISRRNAEEQALRNRISPINTFDTQEIANRSAAVQKLTAGPQQNIINKENLRELDRQRADRRLSEQAEGLARRYTTEELAQMRRADTRRQNSFLGDLKNETTAPEVYRRAQQMRTDWDNRKMAMKPYEVLTNPAIMSRQGPVKSGNDVRDKRIFASKLEKNKYISDHLNGVDGAKYSINGADMAIGKDYVDARKNFKYVLMNDVEVATYETLLRKNEKEAEDYLKSLDRELNRREAALTDSKVQQTLRGNKALQTLGTVAEVVASPGVGIQGTVNMLRDAIKQERTGRIEPADINAPEWAPVRTSMNIEATTQERMNGWQKFVYDTLVSTGKSGMSMLVAPIGGEVSTLAVMGSEAAANTAYEMAQKGFDRETAFKMGLVSAAIESATEKIGLDNLFKIAKMPQKTGKAVIQSLLSQMGAEGAEEFVGGIVEPIANYMLLGNKSDFAQSVQDYMREGYTSEQATKKAIGDICKDVVVATASGALSGGIFGAAGVGTAYANAANTERNVRQATYGIMPTEAGYAFAKERPKMAKVMDGLAQKVGTRVVIDDEETSSPSYYNAKTNELHINKNAKYPIKELAKHEFTHTVEGSKEYSSLVEFMKENLGEEWTNKYTQMERLYDKVNAKRQANNEEPISLGSYNEETGEYSRLVSETVAELSEELDNDAFIERVSNTNSRIAERIKNTISDFAEKLKSKIGENTETDSWEGAAKKWEKALSAKAKESKRQLRNAIFTGDFSGLANAQGETAYTFAGTNSETSDKSMLAMAQEMKENGATNEQILKDTGWFLGADNKWRYEINDGDMELQKVQYAILKNTKREGAYLGQLIKHPKLFEAYPFLRDMIVNVKEMSLGERGNYLHAENSITLNRNIFQNEKEVKQTLVHEIQHAIQNIEGFARGSSTEYWDRIQKRKMEKAIEKANEETLKALKELDENASYEFSAKVREYNRTIWEDEDLAYKLYVELENDEKYGKYFKNYIEKSSYRNRLEKGFNSSDEGKDATELYQNTAGEIEARDSQSRTDMTDEERRNTFPESAKENPDRVFADGDIEIISLSYINDKSLENNVKDILTMSDKEALKRKADGEYIMVLEHTPDIILEKVKNSENHNIIIRFDAAYLATRQNGVLEGHYHNYGKDFADKLIEVLNGPDAILRLDNGRLNLFGTITHEKGFTSIVSVELNAVKDINSKNTAYNLVVSMLPVKENYVNNLISKRCVKVEYEKENLSQVNPQLHKSLSTVNDKSSIDNNISQDKDIVNTYSMKKSEKYAENKNQSGAEVNDRQYKLQDDMAITAEDVKKIQAISAKYNGERVSINDIDSEDLKALEPVARKYYKEMGEKSPFFRAWFGDWRENDNSEIKTIKNIEIFENADKDMLVNFVKSGLKNGSLFRGDVVNRDMSKDNESKVKINIGAQIYNDTLSYGLRQYSRSKNKDEFNVLISSLKRINDIAENSILLNTTTQSKPKNNNSLLSHYLYNVIEVNDKKYILKMMVDESSYDLGINRRAYNLNEIEISPVSGIWGFNPTSKTGDTGETNSPNITVADLFSLVKRFDKNFNPKPSSKVVNEDRTPKVVYHGTDAEFTVFDKNKFNSTEKSGDYVGEGFFFTKNKSTAQKYGSLVMPVYLDIKNPLVINTEADAKNFRNTFLGMYQNGDEELRKLIGGDYDYFEIIEENPGLIRNELQKRGYDGLIDNLYGQYAVFEPNQIKSATDNIGTFDKNNNDIRYKLVDDDATADEKPTLTDYISDIESENSALKEANDMLREQLGIITDMEVDPVEVNNVVKSLIAEMKSRAKVKPVAVKVESLLTEFKETVKEAGFGKEAYMDLFRKLADIGEDIAESGSEVDTTLYDQYQSLRNILSDTEISISESDKSSIPDFEKFRRRNIGRLRIKNKARTTVDSLYKELSQTQMYPEFFPSDITHPADRLMRMSEVLDLIKPKNVGINTEDAGKYIATEIISKLLDNKAEQHQTVIEKVKQQYAEKEKELADKYKKALEDYREERKARADREKLLKLAKEFQNMKTSPENLAKIPEIVKELDTMGINIIEKGYTRDDGTRVMDKIDLAELRKQYQDLKKNDPTWEPNQYIEAKITRLDKTQIGDMDISDVRELLEVLQNLKTEIQNNNRLINDEKRREIYNSGVDVMNEIEEVDTKFRPLNFLGNHYTPAALTPERMARRMVGYKRDSVFVDLVKKLSEGQRKMMDFQMRSSQHFDEFTDNPAELERISGKNADIITAKVYDVKGEPVEVKMTPAMRIALYLHSKNYSNINHIKHGGIVIPDINLYRKGKLTDAYAQGTTIKLDKKNIDKITNDMGEYERKLADSIADWFDNDCKKAINDTSLQLLGYEVAVVNNYMPIKINPEFGQSDPLIMDGTIEGQGNLKSRIGSVKPILLEDILNVVERQKNSVGKYVGLAIPVRNFNKVYNVSATGYNNSVKKAMNKKFGEASTKYFENLLIDLQSHRETYATAIDKLRGDFAQGVLSLNPTVTIKQAASYPTAAAVVGWQPLMQAFSEKVTAEDKAIMQKYTPLLWYRSQGYSMQEIGDYMNGQDGIAKRLPGLMGWIQAADIATTTKLWKAAEFWVRDNTKLEKGSDAYYKKAAEIYNRIIEETQPDYATMQRPDILRNPNQVVKGLMMFSTQRLQNYNILYDSISEYAAAVKSKDKQWKSEATEKLANSLSSQTVSAITLSAMTFVGNLLLGRLKKYKDDDKLTYRSFMEGFVTDFWSSVFGSSIGGGELFNFIRSIQGKQNWYDVSMGNVQAINDFVSSIIRVTDVIESGKWHDIREFEKPMLNLVNNLATLAGIPLENAEKIVTGIYTNALNVAKHYGANTELWEYQEMKLTVPLSKKSQYGKFFEKILQRAYKEADSDEKLRLYSIAEDISNDMIKIGISSDYIQDKVKSIARDIHKDRKEIMGEMFRRGKLQNHLYQNEIKAEQERLKDEGFSFSFSDDSLFDMYATSVSYDGQSYKLTKKMAEKYNAKITEKVNEYSDSVIGADENINAVFSGKALYTDKTSMSQQKRVYDYLIYLKESGKLTRDEALKQWADYQDGKFEMPVFDTYVQKYVKPSEMTYTQRTDIADDMYKKLTKGKITQEEYDQWVDDFKNDNITYKKNMYIYGSYADLDDDTKQKVITKIKNKAKKEVEEEMRDEIIASDK